MKKLLALLFIFLIVPILLVFTACDKPNDWLPPVLRTSTLARPETNLEFWIAENVDNVDFSSHTQKHVYTKSPASYYYGMEYAPTIDENGKQVDPEHCVIYTITPYPDYMNKEKHITYIHITDPEIELYGFSLKSSCADFETIMKKEGWEITEKYEFYRTATKGKYSITFTRNEIRIRVDVRNELGIKW